MHSQYFQIELWKRKRLKHQIEKESLLQLMNLHTQIDRMYEESIVLGAQGDCELIIKHCYVSGDKNTIARISFDGDWLDQIWCELRHV